MLRGELIDVYPIIKQDNAIQIWDRKGYEYATDEEKDRYAQLKEERSAIQSKINAHGENS